jgi:hypothetical protein
VPSPPTLNGRAATVITFTSTRIIPASGPVGNQHGPYGIACGLAFYDPTTGEFLADILRLAPLTQ